MNERHRLPLVATVAVATAAMVVAAVIGLGSLGSSAKDTPSTPPPSTAPTTPTATPAPTATDPLSTLEGATRAFFSAFNKGWLTDDPTLVTPYVTSTDSSAYLSVSSFLGGEKAVHRAAVITTQKLDNMQTAIAGTTATVEFDYTVGGYNTNVDTGTPVETPNVLAPVHVKVTLKLVAGQWLVDEYTQAS
jgi:hypothetical protein